MRMLLVPKVYFERIWPPPKGRHSARVDVVAIDRDGTGDVHVVDIGHSLRDALSDGIKTIRDVPAQYRWVAYQGEGLLPPDNEAELAMLSERPLLPEAGMGRIGVLEVVRMSSGDLGARIRLKAERYQPGDIDANIQAFLRQGKPDIEFKE
jgi:hypothetical protein